MAKRDKNIRKQLLSAGWTIHRDNGKHEIWKCPCGNHPLVTKGKTTGEGRGAKNLRSFIKSEERFGKCAVELNLG